jgi:hypothetical protein
MVNYLLAKGADISKGRRFVVYTTCMGKEKKHAEIEKVLIDGGAK